MRLFLIRHAQTEDRQSGGRDLYRPLSEQGFARARELDALLAPTNVERVLTSPATRCVQTVEPLAITCGLDVEEQPDLWEGSSIPHVLALLENQQRRAVAACTHGDIIPAVVDVIARQGANVSGRGCENGSIWVLDHDGRRWTDALYLDRSAVQGPASE